MAKLEWQSGALSDVFSELWRRRPIPLCPECREPVLDGWAFFDRTPLNFASWAVNHRGRTPHSFEYRGPLAWREFLEWYDDLARRGAQRDKDWRDITVETWEAI